MISTTISGLFGKKGTHDRIYVVLDCSGNPVYVGMAGKQCVTNRMSCHINDVFTKKKPSKFSKYLFSHHPSYFDWQVDIYTLSQIKELVGARFNCLPCAERAMYERFSKEGNTPLANARKPSDKCTCNT